jgi:uroporphyrinogen decarboxylase
MDSKTRVMRSLDFGKVDRIAKFDGYWQEFAILCRSHLGLSDAVDLYDYFGIDIAITSPDESPYPSMFELISENSSGGKLIRNKYGTMEKSREGASFTEEIDHIIKEHKDLDRFPFEDPRSDMRYEQFISQVERAQAKARCVFGKIGGPFIRSTFIRGQTEYLMDIAGDEEFAKELASRVADFLLEVGKQELLRTTLGETGIWIYDDMGCNKGPMMSPRSFERIFYPLYKKMVAGLKKAGAKIVGLHSDGDIRLILDMLVDAGIDCINPVEPRAGMSIVELKKRYGRKLGYIGGMCNSDVLVNGPVKRIIHQASEIIEQAQDGGVVIGAHSIGPDVPIENYLAYMKCVNDIGIMHS